jgi:hypothetical protein
MKTYNKYIWLLICGTLFFNSCSEDFLEVQPVGTALEDNYYKTPQEALNGLIAAYDPLGTECGATYSNKLGPLNSASDDCYAGGGSSSDVPAWQVWNTFTLDAANGIQGDFWKRNFTGVYRSNLILTKLEGAGLDPATLARYTAEAKFLRAFYYFDLVRLFRNVPLFTTPVSVDGMYDVLQAKPEEVYAQIEKDLNEAIADLPVAVPLEENGRVTKLAAAALLGKVILYQNNESRMLEAADLFEQVNSSPNYQLLPNFGDVFSASNEYNAESIFEIAHTSKGMHGWEAWPNFEGNVYTQMIGARGFTGPTYVAGWGFNPIIPAFVTIMKNDPRYAYTVINMDSLVQNAGAKYQAGYQNTGYFVAKYAPLQENYSTIGGDPVINYPNNVIEIRLADTYLMEAEALVRGGGDIGKAQFYLDQVRARVGLPSVPATLDNIYKERRLELATEGHRFFDLVRTGKAAEVLAFKGFKKEKGHELLPIPLTELSNTQLEQNPGYE